MCGMESKRSKSALDQFEADQMVQHKRGTSTGLGQCGCQRQCDLLRVPASNLHALF